MKSLSLLARNKLVLLYAFFTAIYLLLSFNTPIDPDALRRYDLTVGEAKLLTLTIVLPLILIWGTALVGYLRFRDYVNRIKRSKDGQAFRTIASGVLWLGLWLPLSTIISATAKYLYDKHPEFTANAVRLDNYLNLLILIPAFLLVYQGSKKLLPLVKKPVFAPPLTVVLGYIAFAALYVFIVLMDSAARVPVDAGTAAHFYLPDWLIVTSLVIPRLLLWFLGGMAVYNIYVYSKSVKGSLYRSALTHLAIGIAGVVGITIILRFLRSISVALNDLDLGFLLGVIYLLLILLSVGYIFIAKGATNLKKLEDI